MRRSLAVPELQDRAREQGVSDPSEMKKEELLQALSGGSGGGDQNR